MLRKNNRKRENSKSEPASTNKVIKKKSFSDGNNLTYDDWSRYIEDNIFVVFKFIYNIIKFFVECIINIFKFIKDFFITIIKGIASIPEFIRDLFD